MLPAQVAELLSSLDFREQEILLLRYGLNRGRPRTQAEVAQHVDLSREGVPNVEAKALEKLRRRGNLGERDLLSA